MICFVLFDTKCLYFKKEDVNIIIPSGTKQCC